MGTIQYSQGLCGRHQDRDPVHGLFEQRLALEQRTELLGQVIAINFARVGTEANAVAPGKNHRGVVGIIEIRGCEKERFRFAVESSRASSPHLTILSLDARSGASNEYFWASDSAQI